MSSSKFDKNRAIASGSHYSHDYPQDVLEISHPADKYCSLTNIADSHKSSHHLGTAGGTVINRQRS